MKRPRGAAPSILGLALVLRCLPWALGLGCLGCADGPEPQGSVVPAEVKTQEEQTMYAVGYLLGKNLVPLSPNPTEMALVLRGLQDAVRGAAPPLDPEALRGLIQQTAMTRQGVAALRERERGAVALEEAARQRGARRTAAGLVYQELRAGAGPRPTATDRVRLRYQGALLNGQRLDEANEPPRELALGQALPCLREGIPLMNEGAQARLLCPAALAYGERGTAQVPGGAAVVYTVELLKILP